MSKHTATIQIDATPETVWQIVSDAGRLPDWLSPVRGVEGIEPEGPLSRGSKLDVTIGNVGGARMQIKEADAGQRLKWTAGPFMAYMMRMPMLVELSLEGRGESTTATITYKSNPMIGPLMKMMTGLNFKEEAPATVRKLKQAVEAA